MANKATSQSSIGWSLSNMSVFPSYFGSFLLFYKSLSHFTKVNPVIAHFELYQVFFFWPLLVRFVIDIEYDADEIRKWLKFTKWIFVFPNEAQSFHIADRSVTHQLLHSSGLDKHSFVVFLIMWIQVLVNIIWANVDQRNVEVNFWDLKIRIYRIYINLLHYYNYRQNIIISI